jgi:hypothetical protein
VQAPVLDVLLELLGGQLHAIDKKDERDGAVNNGIFRPDDTSSGGDIYKNSLSFGFILRCAGWSGRLDNGHTYVETNMQEALRGQTRTLASSPDKN